MSYDPVGRGETYAPLLAAVRALVPEWVPGGVANFDRWWGAPPLGIVREEDGTNRLYCETYGWEKRGLGHNKTFSTEQLRGAAISILVYCEAHEPSASGTDADQISRSGGGS